MKLKGFPCLLAIFTIFFCALPAFAQTARIKGEVTDSSGAVIPGAAASVTNGTTSKTASTGADGTFAFTGLPAGTYTVSVNAYGFEPHQKPVTLSTGQAVALSFPMA